MTIHCDNWGDGPPVVLVHGSIRNGEATFVKQQPLAERWGLSVVNRRGYSPNPPSTRSDFAVDAEDVANLLGGGAHLVGHSYGGVVAMLAAAARPDAVRSLALTEPPAFSLVRGHPDVEAFIASDEEFAATAPTDPREYLVAFVARVGSDAPLPEPLPPPMEQHARLAMNERPPWEAEIPLATLRSVPFPKLVVSGGHSAAFDAVCDVLEQELPARREILVGAGHSIPQVGAPYNAALEELWTSAAG